MDGREGFTNRVQHQLNEAFAQHELTTIITSAPPAFISAFLGCGEEGENTEFIFFFLFPDDVLVK